MENLNILIFASVFLSWMMDRIINIKLDLTSQPTEEGRMDHIQTET